MEFVKKMNLLFYFCCFYFKTIVYLFIEPNTTYYVVLTSTAATGFAATVSPNGTPENIDSDGVWNDALQRIVAPARTGVTFDTDNLDVDIGLVGLVALGDFVWSDVSGDGVQDPGEPGIEGVVLTLIASGSPDVVATTTTDANGAWQFNNRQVPTLRANTAYAIQLLSPPAGLSQTAFQQGGDNSTDSDARSVNGVIQVLVTSGAQGVRNLDVDIGLAATSVIGDYVWKDTNGNGLQVNYVFSFVTK